VKRDEWNTQSGGNVSAPLFFGGNDGQKDGMEASLKKMRDAANHNSTSVDAAIGQIASCRLR